MHTIIELGNDELVAFAAVVSLLGLAFSAAFAGLPDPAAAEIVSNWGENVRERFVDLSWSLVGVTPEGGEWSGMLKKALLWTFALLVNVLVWHHIYNPLCHLHLLCPLPVHSCRCMLRNLLWAEPRCSLSVW